MPYSERPVARVGVSRRGTSSKRLVAEGRVTISEPDEDELTDWRLVIDYARRHGPPRRASASPAIGPSARAACSPHPVAVALRDDEGRLAMPSALGRALLLFQGLSRKPYSGDTGSRITRSPITIAAVRTPTTGSISPRATRGTKAIWV
ncbi:hypothetical protein SGFS_053060 [Streptomyces graminofaciens]|uniref:Uncharacterized protein n=1 Tax=Streptomyces graminofaciens TaxID=68212 RepID=A0ABM9SC27_9ACTN|nr:hypothetical protein SGFS_053060 [Streptomyces graminofaciens]